VLTLDDAPFREYLKILRKEKREEEADKIEQECLTLFENLGYTEEQLYKTPLKNIHTVIEIYTAEMNRQVMEATQPLSMSESMLLGKGAEELDPNQLQYLMKRQTQLHEDEKLNQMLKK